jgi:membrane protease YdiL (CAAX protease family)
LPNHLPSPENDAGAAGGSLDAFWSTLAVLNLGLAAGGWIFASMHGIAGADAVPIVAAFLVQSSVYLVPGFPEARTRLERRFRPPSIALLAVACSLAPYLVYAVPTNVFSWEAFGKLAAYCVVIAFLFVLAPVRKQHLSWQDAVALLLLGWPHISGVAFFREVYLSPIADAVPQFVPRLDVLGKLMTIPLGATVFLSLRKLEGVGFQLAPPRQDLAAGLRNYALFLPVGIPLALAVRFVHWGPKSVEGWSYLLELVGTMLGTYAAVALAEEFAFRGITQNLLTSTLRKPHLAQLIASVLFGLAHLPTGTFPNWRYALVAAVAGWFYGRAYLERQSIVPAMVAHTLVVVSWRFGFGA